MPSSVARSSSATTSVAGSPPVGSEAGTRPISSPWEAVAPTGRSGSVVRYASAASAACCTAAAASGADQSASAMGPPRSEADRTRVVQVERTPIRSGSVRVGSEDRWVHGRGRASPVERGGAAEGGGRSAFGSDHEALGVADLAVEVGRVECDPPDGLVDPAQLGDGERLSQEGGGQGRVLDA